MDVSILNVIKSKGLLLEKDVFDLLEKFENPNVAKDFLVQLERVSGQKMITKNLLSSNAEYVKSFVGNLKEESKGEVENVFVKLGISLEIRRERKNVGEKESSEVRNRSDYKVFYADTNTDKKIEVKDFTKHFRVRYQQLQKILMLRPELQHNLTSINKLGSDRSSVSLIGIVSEKRVTKNKNIIISFEDLTGKVNVLVKFESNERERGKQTTFSIAEDLQLDDIIGIKGSGNKDMVFGREIFFPDSFLLEKTKFNEDVRVAFLSDVHCGSDRHLNKSLEKFLEWMNSDNEDALKIKYLFFVGDNVDGVGIFPGQENSLNLKSMETQYELLASYLNRIPKRVTIFLCPGQHDASRVAEPQPPISRRYARALYEIDNLILVNNPSVIKLCEGQNEFKILMYHGGSIHHFINEIKELRMMKAHQCPAKAVKEMLKRRHLAPSHGINRSLVYVPGGEKDPLVIDEVPDVLCTGEVHRLDVDNYNGVLIITGSCWQYQTPFEEKIGNLPDYAKVPVLNLRTRELKIFDFADEEEVNSYAV